MGKAVMIMRDGKRVSLTHGEAAETIEAQSKLIEEMREAVIELRDVYTKGVMHMMSGDRGDERLIRAINSANERMDAALSKANPHSEKVE